MELGSLLEAKETLLKARESDCASLQEKLNGGVSRGRSPWPILSVSAPTWDGGAGAADCDEQLRQVMAERDELKARLKRHEDWQDDMMKTVNEVESTHTQVMHEKEQLRRELENMHQELQSTRLQRDAALSNEGYEGKIS